MSGGPDHPIIQDHYFPKNATSKSCSCFYHQIQRLESEVPYQCIEIELQQLLLKGHLKNR